MSRSAARSPPTSTARTTTCDGSFGQWVQLAGPGGRHGEVRTLSPRASRGLLGDGRRHGADRGRHRRQCCRPCPCPRPQMLRPNPPDRRPDRSLGRDGARPPRRITWPGSTAAARGSAAAILEEAEHWPTDAAHDARTGPAGALSAAARCRSTHPAAGQPRPSTRPGGARPAGRAGCGRLPEFFHPARRGAPLAAAVRAAPGWCSGSSSCPDAGADLVEAVAAHAGRERAATRRSPWSSASGAADPAPLSFPRAGWTRRRRPAGRRAGLAPLLDRLDDAGRRCRRPGLPGQGRAAAPAQCSSGCTPSWTSGARPGTSSTREGSSPRTWPAAGADLMLDGTGRLQRVLLLGGTSEIGLATVRALALAPGCRGGAGRAGPRPAAGGGRRSLPGLR